MAISCCIKESSFLLFFTKPNLLWKRKNISEYTHRYIIYYSGWCSLSYWTAWNDHNSMQRHEAVGDDHDHDNDYNDEGYTNTNSHLALRYWLLMIIGRTCIFTTTWHTTCSLFKVIFFLWKTNGGGGGSMIYFCIKKINVQTLTRPGYLAGSLRNAH